MPNRDEQLLRLKRAVRAGQRARRATHQSAKENKKHTAKVRQLMRDLEGLTVG